MFRVSGTWTSTFNAIRNTLKSRLQMEVQRKRRKKITSAAVAAENSPSWARAVLWHNCAHTRSISERYFFPFSCCSGLSEFGVAHIWTNRSVVLCALHFHAWKITESCEWVAHYVPYNCQISKISIVLFGRRRVKMFDDIIFKWKKSFPSSSVREPISDRDEADGSSIAFIERNDFDSNASNRSNNLMGIFRSYINRFNQKNVTDGSPNLMLPRVYAPDDAHCFDWDPIELKAKEKYIEDIDNVIDKFARVISVNETTSPRRNRFFYVHKFFLCSALQPVRFR